MNNKILIVEDEFVTANALRLLLEQSGYRVIGIASSVDEANRYLEKHDPDLVLLDIRLEGKHSGIELAKNLKELNIAFIYLSANSNQKTLEEAKKTEPYGFLVKPYREKDVLIALEIAFYRHSNSLESKFRQKETLQKQLTLLVQGSNEIKNLLPDTARILQPHIPFDIIIAASSNPDGSFETLQGYMRTGYNEYQAISEKAFANTIGNVYSGKKYDSETPQAHICKTRGTIDSSMPFGNMLREHFRIESFITYHFHQQNNCAYHYFFCSRKPDIYQSHHLEILSGIEIHLTSPSEGSNKGVVSKSNAPVSLKPFMDIVGSHPSLLAALDLAAQVAPFSTSVLLLGESGTGKEMVADTIHNLSGRKGPMIKVNCGALPDSLIESELFGYEKGAFTGANENKTGKFELAQGGTIFLDEIGELSLTLQVKLLRVLQQKEINPLGCAIPRKIDVRIVAATNRNLEKNVADGNFRLDLYYRLNVFPITLPPLRDRKSDIIPLAIHFAKKFCYESKRPFIGISLKMTEDMVRYDWPGNIRELENAVERAVILNDGKSKLELRQQLSTDNYASTIDTVQPHKSIRNITQETERQHIVAALSKTHGRIRGNDGAAELLNIKPTTLESKMAKLGINREDFKYPI